MPSAGFFYGNDLEDARSGLFFDFLAAYTAVNRMLDSEASTSIFLAAYTAVNDAGASGWGRFGFLAAYTAVN